VNRIVNPFINTYLSLYITMDPVPGFMKADEVDYIPGFEDSVFLINTTKWLKNLKENVTFRFRNIRLLTENFDGYSVFVSRFLKAGGQKPPEIVFDEINNPTDDVSIEKAARFVSLIPFIEDCQTFDHEEMPDCWCTDEQFLTLGFGDYEEHAILLCNYFNYIDRLQNRNVSSYLVLGKGYPEGMTTYVMRVSNTTPDVEFWNARKGECFYFDKKYHDNKFLCFTVNRSFNNTKNSNNTICSLKEVGCIITPDNVYVNVQSSGDPGFIDFDLKNTRNWKPFLNESSRKKYFPEGIASIQKDLSYEYPSSEESYQLSRTIYEHLKKEIEISRYSLEKNGKPLRTRWERSVNEKIEGILAEYDLFNFAIKKSGINVNIIL
jgi:coiled-coil and C2 domain-containing protein 2A